MSRYLREATEADMDLLFQWANDPAVRQNSFCMKKIDYEEHVNWFRNMMKNSAKQQYIYMCGDEPVGQVRITIDGTEAEIGYSIAPTKRGMGYSVMMLRELRERVTKDYPEIERLIAKVKADNVASQKAVTGAGFAEKYREFELEMPKNTR